MQAYLANLHSLHYKTFVGKANPASALEIIVHFHPKQAHRQDFLAVSNLLQLHPAERKYGEAIYRADEQGLAHLQAFAKANGLELSNENIEERTATLTGTLDALAKAFQITFGIYESEDGQYHLSYEGVISVPQNLAPYIAHITNLDGGLIKGSRSKVHAAAMEQDAKAANFAHSALVPKSGFSPQDIEQIYAFPAGDAAGECIGLIELGGTFKQSDLERYCKLHNIPVPVVEIVGTAPKVPPNVQALDNLEVSLDLEIVAGLAPKAKIVIYYAKTIPEGIRLALNDIKNNPSVLSISWALSEYDMSVSERQLLEYLCLQAAKKGVTLVASSGDHGAYNGKQYLNTMLPASHPLVLGCGGTTLHTKGKIIETVWGTAVQGGFQGSGGGYSVIYPLPNYQQSAVSIYRNYYFPQGQGGRGVPDISANSDASTAYNIVINGQIGGYGAGTSAATPVWAALIARLNKQLGYRLGFIHNQLYALQNTAAFKQVVKGNNGYYPGAYGWDPATGLGSPNGKKLLEAIKNIAPKRK